MKLKLIFLLITSLISNSIVGCKNNSVISTNTEEKPIINEITDNSSIEDNELKTNHSIINEKHDLAYAKLKEDLSYEVNSYFSNINCDYSLIFADITTLDYFGTSNYSNDIKNTKSPSASVIKIFIIVEAYNQSNKGIINLESTIILQENMKVGGSGILSSKPNGIAVTIDELIYLMMTESDNTATNILIDIIGMDNINTKIKELGCSNTELNRKMMDAESINVGIDNYTSVYDLYLTLMQLYNNKCINEFYDNKIIDIMKCSKSTTKIPNLLPDDVLIAHKTGELSGIENDSGIIFTKYGDYILCILTENGSNGSEIEAISGLSKNIYDLFTKYKTQTN